MKKVLLIASIAGFVLIQGCDSDKKKEEASETVGTEQNAIQPEVPTADSIQQTTPITQEALVTQPSINVPPTNSPSNVSATAIGMNPAHGQPGHRCDISVGAPLNSPPGKPTTITTPSTGTQAPAITPAVTTPAINQVPSPAAQVPAGPTPAGMNPPHGQPGHDCAIAVGAPLKK